MTTYGLFAIGDSKTDGDAWVGLLVDNLRSTGLNWVGQPGIFAFGGAQTGATTGSNPALSMAAYVDANLPSALGTANICVITLGVNDSTAVESEWKAYMTSIIDAVRAKYPQCLIYIAKTWSRGGEARSNSLAAWTDDIVATYPSGVYVGHDERVWLENGDDGATYTDDGIHYNAAAEPVVATQWMTALGYE